MTTSKNHIVFTVINDLTYDQRMQRICTSLTNAGYKVTLIGRNLASSKPLVDQPFSQIRLQLIFTKGKLFYLEYNLRLLWHLWRHSYTILGAVDLDTLVPAVLIGRWKGKKVVYDAHEYFSELPEVIHRPLVQKIWEKVAFWGIPKVDLAYTVNQSLAYLFKAKYGKKFEVIRNVSYLKPILNASKTEKYILYQGAVNVGRALPELITAMQWVDCQLYICGKGDVYEKCVALVKKLALETKVKFLGFVAPNDLRKITEGATIGYNCLAPHQGVSYFLSLANKFFDYIHAGIPQLATNYPEYRKFNEKYEVAILLKELSPSIIAKKLTFLLENRTHYERLRENCLQAREEVNWQVEEKELLRIYKDISI